MQGKLSVEQMCRLAGVSRAGFYRSMQERAPAEEDMGVRSEIQKIFAEHKRRYGYRRVSAELRRRGHVVNHKRVARLMREDNLLAVQPKAFVVTTDSDHDLEVYLNLASRMKLTNRREPALGSRHHLHPAKAGVGVLGGDPGCVLAQGGWLGTGSQLDGAIADRGVGEGDCGPPATAGRSASFRSRRPVRLRRLRRAAAKTRHDRDMDHLRENIAAFIDSYYNRVRLHSALGYKPPEEFEQSVAPGPTSQGATLSFIRHEEIFQSDVGSKTEGEPAETGSPDHRLDESPAGYSSAGWSPPEPASASPTEDHCGGEAAD